MKKTLSFVFLSLLFLTFFGCNRDAHTHTCTYSTNEQTHIKEYTCGCVSPEIAEEHYDNDGNQECDACTYFVGKKVSGLAMGTYYLPYSSNATPVSITFFEDGRFTCLYDNENMGPYCSYYRIEDGKVHLSFNVFEIRGNALVYNADLSLQNRWDDAARIGPVVYCLPGISQSELLATVIMARDGMETLPEIEKIYGKYQYTSQYSTQSHDVYAFMVGGSATGACWSEKIAGTDYTFTYTDSREILIYTQGRILTLNEARGYLTSEILEELNKNHHDCEIAHSYDEGVITSQEILYTCKICGITKTVPLPDDFSFTLTWSFDGYYDSKTGELKNGYNYTLDTACETTLLLDDEELANIYRILYNGGLSEIKEDFRASKGSWSPSYDIKIGYTIGGETVAFTIQCASFLHHTEWKVNPAFGYAYYRILEDYIWNSEEYKAMPRNQKIYC